MPVFRCCKQLLVLLSEVSRRVHWNGFEDLDKEEVCGILLVSCKRTLAEVTVHMGRGGPHSFRPSSPQMSREGVELSP